MDVRGFIERLVPEVAHNASVVRVDETSDVVRVTISGTTGVEAGCEVPRHAVEAAAAAEEDHLDEVAAGRRPPRVVARAGGHGYGAAARSTGSATA